MTRASVSSTALCLVLSTILLSLTGQCYGALQVGFYKGKCGSADVELIVNEVITSEFLKKPTIAAALIRMHFHDCFVNGCDASILLDGNSTEKSAPPNLSVRGYEVIDAAKAAVDSKCKGIVSCADIIAMAARDSVYLKSGKINPRYNVETGRRDGLQPGTNVDLPSPSITVQQSIDAFFKKGLNPTDMVYLLGAHTIGVTHCSLFKDRLYNFKNTGKPDPTMNFLLLIQLRSKCPQNSAVNTEVNLDQGISTLFSDIFGTSFYRQIQMKRGVLQIDQEIALEAPTKPTVDLLASDFRGDKFFLPGFGKAMVKMGAIQVLTGSEGQIRNSCRAVNKFS